VSQRQATKIVAPLRLEILRTSENWPTLAIPALPRIGEATVAADTDTIVVQLKGLSNSKVLTSLGDCIHTAAIISLSGDVMIFRTFVVSIAVVIVLGQLTCSAQAKKRLALLVSNQAYNATVGSLSNPHKDIDRVGKALKKIGFELRPLLKDKPKDDVLLAVHDFAEELGKKGDEAIGFFYYAGHGIAVNGQNYLLPYDITDTTPRIVEVKGLGLNAIVKILRDKAPHAAHFLAIDACRNELKGSRGAIPLVKAPIRNGVHIAFSTQPGFTATDGGAEGIPFAIALAEEIGRPGKDHDDVYRSVKRRVFKMTKGAQDPWAAGDISSAVFFAGQPKPKPPPPPVKIGMRHHAWKISLAFPSKATVVGSQAIAFGDDLQRLSDSRLKLNFLEPNTVVPTHQLLNAVGKGVVPLGWSTPGLWADKSPTFALFGGGLQIGISPQQYVKWISEEGSGQLNAAYRKYNVRSVPCGLSGSVSGALYKFPIRSPEDLKGLKIRATGWKAEIARQLGAKPVTTAGGETFMALERGVIDATLWSNPAQDTAMGIQDVAKYYYHNDKNELPAVLDVLVNLDTWNALSRIEQNTILFACETNLERALRRLPSQTKDRGALIEASGGHSQNYPSMVAAELQAASKAVVTATAMKNASFRVVVQSLEKNTNTVVLREPVAKKE